MSDHILQSSTISTSIAHNLTTTTHYSYPILTRVEKQVYHYSVSKEVRDQRKEPIAEVYDIPYDFMVATLKYLVHKSVLNPQAVARGEYPQTLLLAKSQEHGFAIALLVDMQEYLLTIHSAIRVPVEEFDTKRLQGYPMQRKHFFKALDLDAYVQEKEAKRREKRQKIAQKYPAFWKDETRNLHYRYSCTKHLKKARNGTSTQRLTIPVDAVRDILRYAMESSILILEHYLHNSEKEKQLVLIFPSIDKSYNIGLLISIDDILVTVISMYDVPPKDKGFPSLIFPNVKRLMLLEYDLARFMERYHEKQQQSSVKKGKMVGSITIVSSKEEYRVLKTETKNNTLGRKPLRIIHSKERVEQCNKEEEKREKLSVLLGIGMKLMQTKRAKQKQKSPKRKKR